VKTRGKGGLNTSFQTAKQIQGNQLENKKGTRRKKGKLKFKYFKAGIKANNAFLLKSEQKKAAIKAAFFLTNTKLKIFYMSLFKVVILFLASRIS
jgi:hypothetical protein